MHLQFRPHQKKQFQDLFLQKNAYICSVFFSVQMNRTCFLCVPVFVGNNGMLREAKSLNAENF
jgi:hypothetical protein